MRHTEIRVAVAQMMRQLTASMPTGALRADAALRTTIMDHVSETYRHLTSVSSGAHFANGGGRICQLCQSACTAASAIGHGLAPHINKCPW